ncbi:MAG: hypothetical protein ACKVWR_07850 [Acidimicrobiales bacterium]
MHELDLDAALLPQRDSLGIFDIAVITPINLAIAVNAGGLGLPSLASANAGQTVGSVQG